MNEGHFPSVDIDFIDYLLKSCGKVENIVKVGSTIAYLLKGTSHIGKRTLIVRRIANNTVDYNCATGIAIRVGKMGELLKWYEDNRQWKEGEYFNEK